MNRSTRTSFAAATLALLTLPFAASCSKDDGGSEATGAKLTPRALCDLPAVCQDIIRACHSKDDGSPSAIHDCHAAMHEDGTEESCAAMHDDCVEMCNAAPVVNEAGPSCPGWGATDAGSDGE